MPGAGVAATLPHGLWVDGIRHVDAELRPLNGADEEFLLESAPALLPAERTTALLTHCLVRLGPNAPPDVDAVRALAVGDREALLLQLRRATFGDRLDCVVECPACGETLDVAVAVGELLLEPYPDATEWLQALVDDGRRVVFRPVTGADQEAGARLALEDLDAAAALVVRRCVEADGDEPARDLEPAVAALLAEADPQAEVVLNVACSACPKTFAVALDAAAFLERELAGRRDELYRELHVLASHYHWSEAELLSLTPAKRRRYLELIADGEER